MKQKIKKSLKTAICTILSVIILLSAFPTTVFAGTYITDMNSNAEFGVVGGSYDKYGHEMHYSKYDGTKYIVFCCQFGTTSPNGSTYDYGSDFKKYVNNKGDLYDEIAKYIAFGYTLKYGDSVPNTKKKWIAACCTQQYVWEKLGVNPSRSSWNSTYMSDTLYKSWLKDTEDLIDVYYKKKPSFNKSTKSLAIGKTTTLTDSNGVFKYYPTFSKTINKITFSHTKGNNKLSIAVADDCTTHSLSFNSAAEKIYMGLPTGDAYNSGTMNYAYFNFTDGSVQDVMFSKFVDPQTFVIDVNVKFGNLKIKKTSEDGIVNGVKFTISGNGINQNVTTNSKGEFVLKNIAPGTYTVTEEIINKYVQQKSQTVTVKNGQTATVSFSNKLKKFNVTVTKQDVETKINQGDATLAGAVYGVYQGDTLIDKYTTDANGQFTSKYYVCGDNWSVKEITPSTGYTLNKQSYSIGAKAENYTIEFNTVKTSVSEQVIKGKVSIIKHTDDGSTQIETPEKGATFQIYLKSAGSFANAKETEKDTMICDDDGFASSKLMPYGIYTVHQTKGWDGRENIADFDVFINADGKTYKFLINNANFTSYLKVVKKDAETGKAIPYEGAGFEIYDTDGKRVTMQFTYPTVTKIHTFYTNNEGYLITPEKLPYGDYTLVEVQAPMGYVLDSTPIKFSINQENTSTDTGVTVVKVTAKDMPQKGTLTISKTGEVFSTVTKNEESNIYTPIYEVKGLANATYQITASEDVITPDGTLRVEKGTVVDTVTTDENGIGKSKELYLGKYDIEETEAPDGMVLNSEKQSVELTYAGQEIAVTNSNLSVYNERQKVSINLRKLMEQDKTFGIGNNKEISFVQFGVFANEDITAGDGKSIPKDGLICIANCNNDGKITFDCDLPLNSNYYVKEIATDNHYNLEVKKYEFNTEYQGQDKNEIIININDGQGIENTLKRGSVKGLKLDRETNNAISGVVFGLYNSASDKEALLKVATDKEGIFTFTNIPYGSYIVKEIETAKGYILSDETFAVQITENGQIIELMALNDKIPEIKTTATINGKKEVDASKEITINDTVEYKHLIPGKEYVIKGTLMDKATGKSFKVKGKEITSTVKFIPKKANGKIVIDFTFEGSYINRTTDVVVFETLYKDNIKLTTHADINDKGQTVTIKFKKPTTPKTGDDRNTALWIVLAAISAFGIGVCGVLKFKKKKEDNE